MSLRFNQKAPTTQRVNPAIKTAMSKSNAQNKAYTMPLDLPQKYRMIIVTKRYRYGRTDGKKVSSMTTYNLPVPEGISDATKMQYASQDLGLIKGGLAAAAAPSVQNVMETASAGNVMEIGKNVGKVVVDQTKGAINSLQGMNGADAAQAAAVGLQAGAKFLPKNSGLTDIGGVVGAITGVVPNPQATTFFKGVDIKSYSFSWKLYPQSSQEANDLQAMLYKIRAEAMPTRSLKGLGLTYPYEFHIRVISGGDENLTLFRPAFMDSINIGYAPGGVAFAEDGRAIGYNVTMSFKEIDIWTREDYEAVQVSG